LAPASSLGVTFALAVRPAGQSPCRAAFALREGCGMAADLMKIGAVPSRGELDVLVEEVALRGSEIAELRGLLRDLEDEYVCEERDRDAFVNVVAWSVSMSHMLDHLAEDVAAIQRSALNLYDEGLRDEGLRRMKALEVERMRERLARAEQ
jgi:hypothetical protein